MGITIMPTTSSANAYAFVGDSITSSKNADAFPIVTASSPSPSTNQWNTVDEVDWSAQASTAVLNNSGTTTIGGKTITAYLVGGTGVFTTQCINGFGIVFTCVSGQAGSGSCGFRYDLDTSLFNVGEPMLVDYVVSGISAWGTDGNVLGGIGNGNNFSNGEHYGVTGAATAGPALALQARRYSTAGGVATANMATGVTQPTDMAFQILYMGNVGAFVACKSGATDYMARPVIGAASPFDATGVAGSIGSDSRSPVAVASEVIFGTTMRFILGVGTRNMSVNLKKVRMSRMTRM
jgi:hypothetical protein